MASSWPSSFAVRVTPSSNVIVIEDAPSTTCDAVTMWPSLSMTKPVPVAVASDCGGGPSNGVVCSLADETPVALMSTTPADVLAYSASASSRPSAAPSPEEDVAADPPWTTVVVPPPSPPTTPVTARTPTLAPPPSIALSTSSRASGARRGDRPAGAPRSATAATSVAARATVARPTRAGDAPRSPVLVGGPEIGPFWWTQQ